MSLFVCISLNTTVHDPTLWLMMSLYSKGNNILVLFLYCFLVSSPLQCSNTHSNLLRPQCLSLAVILPYFHRLASRCVWVHRYHFSASALLILSQKQSHLDLKGEKNTILLRRVYMLSPASLRHGTLSRLGQSSPTEDC